VLRAPIKEHILGDVDAPKFAFFEICKQNFEKLKVLLVDDVKQNKMYIDLLGSNREMRKCLQNNFTTRVPQ
jgi:hypothetical protein